MTAFDPTASGASSAPGGARPEGSADAGMEADRAMEREDAERSARPRPASPADRLSLLPRILRGIGAVVLVASGLTFLLQSFEGADDVARCLHLLAFTGALAGAGFLCGLRFGDDKSARTLLALAAGSVPVHFTVLGALLYSQFPWLSGFSHYPDYARFAAPDGAAALATSLLGVGVLSVVCWMAFLALARPEARRLTFFYLLANATLLVPTRHPDVIGGLALGLLLGVVAFDRAVLGRDAALRTPEGLLVRLLMATPFSILIGRTFNLYEPSALFFSAILASQAVVLFTLVPSLLATRRAAVVSQHAALVPTAGAWALGLTALDPISRLGEAWLLPLYFLPIAGLFAALSARALDGGVRMRIASACAALGGMTLQLVLFPSVLSSVGCVATAILVVCYGHAAANRSLLGVGIIALGFALLTHLRYASELVAWSPWGALGLLGIATVVGAALLERHHRALARRGLALWRRISLDPVQVDAPDENPGEASAGASDVGHPRALPSGPEAVAGESP